MIQSLDLETKETTNIVKGEFPRYAEGHLFFVTPDSTLMRMPFDPERMSQTGDPEQMDSGVLMDHQEWWYIAASQAGRLLLATGTIPPLRAEFVWVTREGEVTPVDSGWTFNPGYDNRGFSLNGDGSELAYSALTPGALEDVYVKPLPHGGPRRLIDDPGRDVRPRWTPGGDSLVFIATTGEPSRWGVFTVGANRPGEPRELLRHTTDLYEALPSPVGGYLVVRSGAGPGSNRRDILGFKLETDSLFSLTENGFNERAVSFSPDGRFVLYESDESSQNEIYVQSFHDDQEFESVSTGGGVMPIWSHKEDEIFYIDSQNNMTVALVETDPAFAVTDYRRLFQIPEDILFHQYEWYTLFELAREDDRFLMIRVLDSGEADIELIFFQK